MAEDQTKIPQPEEPPKEKSLLRPGDLAQEMGFTSGEAFNLLNRAATALSKASIVPGAFRENPANCIIALNLASRLKADPLMVMQNLYVVQGKPAWSAVFLIATLNQSGEFSKLRYEWEGSPATRDKDETGWRCRAWAIEKSTNEKLYGSWVSWKLAVDEGWVSKNGSKWRTMPDQMFMYRAASFFVKTYAPEIAMGLPTREEMQDAIDLVPDDTGGYVPDLTGAKEITEEAPQPKNGAEKAQSLKEKLANDNLPPAPEPDKPADTSDQQPENEGPEKLRSQLADLFEAVKDQKGIDVARQNLELAGKTTKLAKVSEENLQPAIDRLTRVLSE